MPGRDWRPATGHGVQGVQPSAPNPQPATGHRRPATGQGAPLCPCGQGVGVEDHARSSGASLSNSSSIVSRTRRCSSARSDNAPKPAIQGGRPFPARLPPAQRRSCSSSASVKKLRKVTPRAAASALACRNTASGRSMVVFIGPCFHEEGHAVKPLSRFAGVRPTWRGAASHGVQGVPFGALVVTGGSVAGGRWAVPPRCARCAIPSAPNPQPATGHRRPATGHGVQSGLSPHRGGDSTYPVQIT